MKIGLNLPPQLHVYGGFFIYSFCMGSLFPRIPDIRNAMGVEEGALGLALIGSAVGTLISLTFFGGLIERIGHRRVILFSIPSLALCYAIAVLAPSPLALFLLLVPTGLLIGVIEIVLNLEADRTEHALGRRIMNRSHGFWSIGFFTSGLIGAFIAQTGLSPQIHLALMVPIVVVGVTLVLGRFQPAAHRVGGSDDAGPRLARPSLAIMMLVAITLSAMVLEGAGGDWSAIYMRDMFAVEPFLAGFAVAIGAGTQALTRFFADGFVERYNPVLVARTLLSVLGIGAISVFLAPNAIVALTGFALMGVGTSAIFPLAMSAAAQRTDRPAAVNVAALAQISFVAFLLGPPLLGFVAQHFGIQWAFGAGIPLVALSIFAAGALSPRPSMIV
ncbi:MFS transporter [Devosia rhodophyticola]|uniref:MFS transporter n=1 Tax=Devosia rhodophyticola TaxID=3026423 RepID=A0ABY7Z0P3_9HYPH|nr:MFS transporter [Devosia rhodophyticola]WDR07191.1 MFS transporter [Devosia rhodophyticola]